MFFRNVPRFARLALSESVPASFGVLYTQIYSTPSILSESSEFLSHWRGRCVKVDSLCDYNVVENIDVIHSLRATFMESQLQHDVIFFVRTLFLPVGNYEEITERNSFSFTDISLKTFIAQSIFSVLL